MISIPVQQRQDSNQQQTGLQLRHKRLSRKLQSRPPVVPYEIKYNRHKGLYVLFCGTGR